jgi:hypothetical protein
MVIWVQSAEPHWRARRRIKGGGLYLRLIKNLNNTVPASLDSHFVGILLLLKARTRA